MRVWVLDDAHFPSGYCNGRIKTDSPYRKTYLTRYSVDAVGPMRGSSFLIQLDEKETFVGAVAARRDRTRENHMEISWISPIAAEGISWNGTCRRDSGVSRFLKRRIREPGDPGISIRWTGRRCVSFWTPYTKPIMPGMGIYLEALLPDFFPMSRRSAMCAENTDIMPCIGQPTMNLPWSAQLEQMLRFGWKEQFCVNLMAMWQVIDEPGMESANRTGS